MKETKHKKEERKFDNLSESPGGTSSLVRRGSVGLRSQKAEGKANIGNGLEMARSSSNVPGTKCPAA